LLPATFSGSARRAAEPGAPDGQSGTTGRGSAATTKGRTRRSRRAAGTMRIGVWEKKTDKN
jgi:hypothetical protein